MGCGTSQSQKNRAVIEPVNKAVNIAKPNQTFTYSNTVTMVHPAKTLTVT